MASPWDVFDRRRRKVNFSKEWSAEVYHLAKRKGNANELILCQSVSSVDGFYKQFWTLNWSEERLILI